MLTTVFISILTMLCIATSQGTPALSLTFAFQQPQDGSLLGVTKNGTNPFMTKGDAGDEASSILDRIILEANKSESVIVIISRLGEGESSQSLHRRRLHNAITRMVCGSMSLRRDKVVAAIGERMKGLGRIEFYFEGRLVYVAMTLKNRDFTVDCCGNDFRYYPLYKGKAGECLPRKTAT